MSAIASLKDRWEVRPALAFHPVEQASRRAVYEHLGTGMKILSLGRLMMRFGRKREEQKKKDLADIKELVALDVDSDAMEVDADFDHYEEAMERQGFSTSDIEFNRSKYLERYRKRPLAVREAELRAKAEKAWEDARIFDLEEGKRHREALIRLGLMNEEARLAQQDAEVAMAAKSDLIAGADPPHDVEKALAELTPVNQKLAELNLMLDPSDREDGGVIPNYYLSNVSTRPARLAKQCGQMLSDKKVGYSDERRQEIQRTLEKANAEVDRLQKKREALVKRRDELLAQSTLPEDWALDPINFRLARRKPTDDELRRKHAYDVGLGRNDPGYRVGHH